MIDEEGKGEEQQRTPIVHPFLLALLPLLSLYSYNAGRVSPVLIWRAALVLLLTALVCLLVLKLVMRDWRRAALGASLLVFASTAGWGVLEERVIEPLQSARAAAPLYAVLILVMLVYIGRSKRDLGRLTVPLNLFSVILIGLFLVNAAFYTYAARCPEAPAPPAWAQSPQAGRKPNVYLLALEGYPRSDVLRNRPFALNNQPFLNRMRGLGFEVASSSRLNYPFALENLAAFLDMRYIHDEKGDVSTHRDQLLCVLGDSLSHRLFEALGYERIMVAGSAQSPVPRVGAGAVRRPFLGLNVIETVLLERTFLARTLNMYAKYTGGQWETWRRFNAYLHADFAFEEMLRIAVEEDGPHFAYAHVSAPRGPAMFDRGGGFSKPGGEDWGVEAMHRQYAGLHKRITKMAAALLEADPEAVIVILSVEGLEPQLAADLKGSADASRCLSNLLMARLPGAAGGDAGIYPGITPVNCMRGVMRLILEGDVPFEEDRVFCIEGEDTPHYEELTTP